MVDAAPDCNGAFRPIAAWLYERRAAVTYRNLEDSMGTVRVPVDAYYGAQT